MPLRGLVATVPLFTFFLAYSCSFLQIALAIEFFHKSILMPIKLFEFEFEFEFDMVPLFTRCIYFALVPRANIVTSIVFGAIQNSGENI